MTAMAQAFGEQSLVSGGSGPGWVRGWADALPFDADSFDASFCKGAMDHFDDPEAAIAEMARVTKRDGRVVLAIANFDSLACRVTRAIDEFREDWLGWGPMRGRRGYDTPSDHFTRYELDLMKEQASRHVDIETIEGVSIGWGLPGWATLVCRLPRPLVDVLLKGLDTLARQFPTLSDVIIVVGRPRLDRSTSSE
jgi:SAM-dependent methyltransferase